MFEGLFDFVDKVIGFFGSLWEKDILQIIVVVAIGLLFLTIIVLSVFLIKGNPFVEDVPQEKQDIMDNAPSFCSKKGLNSWKWVNESEFSFTCYNQTEEQMNIGEHYIS